MGARRLRVGICTGLRSNIDHGDDPMGRNPLGWTLASLVAQDMPIERVFVMKHGESAPGFLDVVERFRARLPISVETWSRSEPLGTLRNRLVELAEDDLLYFLDDDAILFDGSGLSRQVSRLRSAGAETAVLQAPVLRRSVHPRVLSDGELPVARVRWGTGEVTFAFDSVAVPEEAGETGRPDPDAVPLLAIDHLCLAQCLVDPILVGKVGGFTTFPWPAVYGQESELAVRLSEAGFGLVFLPDAASAVVHLKFGAPHWTGTQLDEHLLAGGIEFSVAARLAEAEASAAEGESSWSRKTSAGFFADFVGGFGAVFASRGQQPVDRFLANVARLFVAGNALHHPFVVPIASRQERAAAFLEGVRRLEAGGLYRSTRDWAVVVSCLDVAAWGPAEPVWI